MAPKACSPFPAPRLIQEFEEEDAILKNLFGTYDKPGQWIQVREGADAKYLKMMTERLQAMWSIPLDKVFENLNGKVWDIVDKEGIQLLRPKTMDAREQGMWASVFADYLHSKAQGIRQMAENFIAASSTPGGGLTQGLELARQLQFMGSLGEVTMGLQQATGVGLRVQGLRKRGLVANAIENMDARDAAQGAADARNYNNRLGLIAEMLNDPARSAEGLQMLLGEADRIKFMNDPINIVKGSTGYKLANNAWNEWTINSMLSNPATWVTNAAGVGWAPMRAAAQLLGAGMYRGVAAAGLADPAAARQLWAQSTGQLAAMQSSFVDAMIISKEAFLTGRSLYDNWALDGAPDLRAITGENAEIAMQKLGMTGLDDTYKKHFDLLGWVIRFPSRALLGADEFAKIITQRGEVAQRGIKRAVDAGVDPGNEKVIREYMDAEAKAAFEVRPDGRFGRLTESYDSASALQEGFGGRTVKRVGDEATFQEPNAVARGMNNMIGKAPVLKPFLPFVKTPSNIIKQGVMENTLVGPLMKLPGIAVENRLSPTGIILDIQKRMMADPANAARITGQITFMTTVMAGIYGMAMNGTMTGGGPSRWGIGTSAQQRKAQQAWERANVPYSFKLGDGYIPFDKFPEPLATLMRLTADMGAASAYMTEEEKDGAFGTLVGVATAGLYNSSMLKGLDQLISTIKNPGEFNQRMGSNVQYWFATQTPLGGLMSFVDKLEDPYRSAYQQTGLQYMLDFEEIFGRGVLGKVAERFPGGSGVRPVAIDQLYGEPVPISPGFGPNGLNPLLLAIPFMPRTLDDSGDEAWKAVFEMTGGWSDYKPSGGLELSVGQQQELNQEMGTMRIGGLTLSQAIMKLRREPEVEAFVQSGGSRAPSGRTGVSERVRQLRSQYGQAALQKLLAGSVELQQQQALQMLLRQQKRNNDLAGARTTSQQLRQLYRIAGID